MKLTENQKIVAKLLAWGVSQAEAARRLDVTQATIYNWLKKKVFREERDFWIQRANEIWERNTENVLGLASDRLVEIVRDGKDADSLKAIEMILRTKGKMKDTLEVKDVTPGKGEAIGKFIESLARAELAVGITYKGTAGEIAEEDKKIRIRREPRKLIED